MRNRAVRQGFGLVEMLVVIIIIVILAAIFLPRLVGSGGKDASGNRVRTPTQRARQAGGAAYIQQINQAIQMYKMDNDGQNPPNLQALLRYGVTDEMLRDPNTRQYLPYDPRTGTVAGGGTGLGRVPGF